MTKNLQEFLYLLMRDEVPPGTIRKVLQRLEETDAETIIYTNKFLASMALVYAENILENRKVSYEKDRYDG
jgi:hypothetical protein